MKWIADVTSPQALHLEIILDSKAGYYLYVWKNGKGENDMLQDSLEKAMDAALHHYQVPRDAWRRAE